ncbi:hypothetical protein TWF481_003820 [Arthrobotrys musiformis]|uniref:AAA+ ATPase domain-containing protein n=1 Tax=Arthrobotrys musiformis TaxID=47236 RepID=A0AAV9WIP2_9PEZI
MSNITPDPRGKKGQVAASRDGLAASTHQTPSHQTRLEGTQASSKKPTPPSKGKAKVPNTPSNLATPSPQNSSRRESINSELERRTIHVKREEISLLPPAPEITDRHSYIGGSQWQGYQDSHISVTGQTLLEHSHPPLLQDPPQLSQKSSTPRPPYQISSTGLYLPYIPSPSPPIEKAGDETEEERNSGEEEEECPEKKPSPMTGVERTQQHQSSLVSVRKGVRGLKISKDRAAATPTPTQKRKRFDSRPQRNCESPQVIIKEESLPEEVIDPLECEMARERDREGQFAVHSELVGGRIVRDQVSKCKLLLKDLGETLGKLPKNKADLHIKDIREDIEGFLSCTAESGGIVGFLGESGAGKTTLLNALLDMDNFLPRDYEGICMPVIIELAKSRPGKGAFTIEIQYLTKAQLDGEAEMLFREIYVKEPPGIAPTRLHKPGSKEAKAISNRFKYLFAGADIGSILEAFNQIDKLFAENPILEGEEVLLHCQSRVECMERLRDFTLGSGSKNPGMQEKWPLIHKLRVYLDAEILNTGAILADIPGTDNPYTRVKAMQDYMASVQDLVILTKLDNLFVDDTNVLKKIGYEGVTVLDGRSRGIIVANHLDDYTPEKAQEWFKESDDFQNDFDQISGDLDHARNQFSHAKRGKNADLTAEMATNVQIRERKLEQLCSSALDEFLPAQARKTFGNATEADDEIEWTVFRVNPIRYVESKKYGTFPLRVREDKNVHQMVELKDYIGSLTYRRQYRLSQFRVRQAQSIIANLLFWSSSEVRIPPGSQAALERHLRLTVTKLESEMDAAQTEIAEKISSSLAVVYSESEIAAVESVEKAQEKLLQITSQETATALKLICRGGGEIEGTDWNSQLMEHLKEKMSQLWKDTTDYTVHMVTVYQMKYFDSMGAIENHFERAMDCQRIDENLKGAFKKVVTKELQNSRSQMVEICRDAIREILNRFRYGARTFLRPDTFKNWM